MTFNPSYPESHPEVIYELPSKMRIVGHYNAQVHEGFLYLLVQQLSTRHKQIIRIPVVRNIYSKNYHNITHEVIYKDTVDQVGFFKITEPYYTWSNYGCNACDPGRFCTVAWDQSKNTKENNQHAKSVCVC